MNKSSTFVKASTNKQKLKVESVKLDLKIQISNSLKQIIKELVKEDIVPIVEMSEDLSHGDFSSNVAMATFSKIKNHESRIKNPLDLAEEIVDLLNTKYKLQDTFRLIEAKKPGFINFWLSDEEIDAQVDRLIQNSIRKIEKNGKQSHFAKASTFVKTSADRSRGKIIFEFGDPNPFKELHIGHLRNLILGESIIRLLESQGYEVIRANYQGDVGLHVAKCLWGILQKSNIKNQILNTEEGSLKTKTKALGEAYRYGAEKYESDKHSKKEIELINVKIYSLVTNTSSDKKNDIDIYSLWQKGREISLDHFENMYKLLDIKYDNYYFESDATPLGKEIVEKNVPQVFEKNDGAIIYRGDMESLPAGRQGLHTRVFVTGEGYPTYEAKDLALALLKNKDYQDADKSIIMTANEQIDYFKVVLKALEKVDNHIAGKTTHLHFGFVNLKEGKMSSRTGNVVNAFWLFEEVEKRLKEAFRDVEKDVLKSIAIGAVKWSMLKFSRESDISFSIDESIDLEGNSGPYIQYAYARNKSILDKISAKEKEATPLKNLSPEDLALARLLCQFEIVKNETTKTKNPNTLCNYLFEVSRAFNRFYEGEKILGSGRESEKIKLVRATSQVLKNGLHLLGIASPERI